MINASAKNESTLKELPSLKHVSSNGQINKAALYNTLDNNNPETTARSNSLVLNLDVVHKHELKEAASVPVSKHGESPLTMMMNKVLHENNRNRNNTSNNSTSRAIIEETKKRVQEQQRNKLSPSPSPKQLLSRSIVVDNYQSPV